MRVFFYVSIDRIIGAPQSGPPRPLVAAAADRDELERCDTYPACCSLARQLVMVAIDLSAATLRLDVCGPAMFAAARSYALCAVQSSRVRLQEGVA